MNLRLFEPNVSGCVRILLIDLLVERATFGHGGNQEVIRPFAARGDVELLLVTPQMQKQGERVGEVDGIVPLEKNDVPLWDEDYAFWQSKEIDIEGRIVRFQRILMPMNEDDNSMRIWLESIEVDAVVCSGSRRNVSMWEDWMAPTASLMRASVDSGKSTLGICFGHQLLCHALGAKIERADSLSSGIWNLDFTEQGEEDELLTSHRDENACVAGLFTHQDHVMTIPENCTLLCTTSHNGVAGIRVNSQNGEPLPAWGLQFHPEAAKARIERAYEWGHITKEELESFRGEHDGAGILDSFSRIVLNSAI